jgi:hypothetical protein
MLSSVLNSDRAISVSIERAGLEPATPDYECSFFEFLFGSKKSGKWKYLKHLQGFMFLNGYN